MNPQSNYDLHEQKRLELLQNSEQAHHHNLLLGIRPKPLQIVPMIKNSVRSIPRLRHLRVRVQFEMVEPNPKGVSY